MIPLVWACPENSVNTIEKLLEKNFDGDYVVLPVIRTQRLELKNEIIVEIKRKISKTTALLITSKVTANIIEENERLSFLKNLKCYCVGEVSYNLCLKYGFNTLPDLIFTSAKEACKAMFQDNYVDNYILPGAKKRAENYNEIFSSAGLKNSYQELDLYNTLHLSKDEIPNKLIQKLMNFEASKFISLFSSPSCAFAYQSLGFSFGEKQIAIGKTTSNALESLGYTSVYPGEPSYASMLNQLEN